MNLKSMFPNRKNKLIDIQSNPMVARGEGGGGWAKKEKGIKKCKLPLVK